MASFFGVDSSSSTQTEQLVEAYRKTQQKRIDDVQGKINTLERRSSFYRGLNSRINSLVSALDKFTAENASENFFSRKISSSDNTIVTASASEEADLGSYTIRVNQKASKDVLISDRLNIGDSFGEAAGTKTISFSINGNTKTYDIEFDGTETNEQALKKIASAINDDEDSEINAAYVKDTTSTGKISFTSKETGGSYDIEFTDSDVLAKLGLTTGALNPGAAGRTLANDTTAGYKTANDTDLNSEFELNGISITRDSNSVDDVVEGITFNLLKVQEADDPDVSLTTEIDSEAVKNFINPLLKAYNQVLELTGSSREIRRADSAVNSLQFNLRGASSLGLDSVADGVPKYIFEAGIESDSSGKLTLTDTEKLQELLEDDPQKVADLFLGSGGFAERVNSVIENLTGDNGLIKSRTLSLSGQIDSANDRLDSVKSRIDIQVNNLRKEYTDYLRTFYEAQSQYNLLSTFDTSSLSSGYGSLLGGGGQ